jgi:hypothetical protein
MALKVGPGATSPVTRSNDVDDAPKVAADATAPAQQKSQGWAAKTPARRPVAQNVSTAPRPSAPSSTAAGAAATGAAALSTASQAQPSVVKHSWFDALSSAAHSLGTAMQSAGAKMSQAGDALGLANPLGLEAKALGAAYTMFGKGVDAAPKGAQLAASAVHDRAVDLEKKGEALYAEGKRQLATGVKLAEKGVEKVGEGAQAVGHAVKAYAEGVAHAVDYKDNIQKLGPGDKYTIGLDGYAGVEGIRVAGKGNIEVSKGKDGKYTVGLDGEIAGGLYGEVGGKVAGLHASGEASAMLGVGGKLELKFDSQEEATKAAGILLKRAGTMGAVSALAPPGLGGAAAALAAPSKDELKFLGDHVSAMELTGNVAAEALGTLGVKGVAGLMGGVEAKVSSTVRLEVGEGAPKVVVKQTLAAGLEAGAGLRLQGKGHNEENEGFLTAVGGKGEAEVSIERQFSLPKGVTFDQLKHEPLKTLKAVGAEMKKTEVDSVAMGYELSGGAMGSGGGVGGEVKLSANLEELQKSGAVAKALKGDFKGALAALPESTEVEGKSERFATYGVKTGPIVSVMGFGVGLELQAQRKDVDEGTVKSFKMPAKDAFEIMNDFIKKAPVRTAARE